MALTRKKLQAAGLAVLSVVVAIVAAVVTGDDGSTTARDPGGPGAVASSASASMSASASASTPATTDPSAEESDTGSTTDPESGLPLVREQDLPSLERQTLALIDSDGPYPEVDAEKNGSTFGNYEGLLPPQRRGYYREYTVLHPGTSSRGARRIITGEGGEFYWTSDHYESFARIARS